MILHLISDKHEFIVMIPSILFRVDAGFEFSSRSSSSASATTGQAPASLLQIVEGLLNKGVFEEESAGVSVNTAMVRVAAFVYLFLGPRKRGIS